VGLRDAVALTLLTIVLYVAAVYVIWAVIRINKDEINDED
jgi:hypothetical protein